MSSPNWLPRRYGAPGGLEPSRVAAPRTNRGVLLRVLRQAHWPESGPAANAWSWWFGEGLSPLHPIRVVQTTPDGITYEGTVEQWESPGRHTRASNIIEDAISPALIRRGAVVEKVPSEQPFRFDVGETDWFVSPCPGYTLHLLYQLAWGSRDMDSLSAQTDQAVAYDLHALFERTDEELNGEIAVWELSRLSGRMA